MNAKKMMKTGTLALLLGSLTLPPLATASVVKSDSLGNGCSGGCVDVWQINCTAGATYSARAFVRDAVNGNDSFAVTTFGYRGPKSLVGQADREVSPLGSTNYSIYAGVHRAVGTHGATSALVAVDFNFPGGGSAYDIKFECKNGNGTEVGDPVVKLLQDE